MYMCPCRLSLLTLHLRRECRWRSSRCKRFLFCKPASTAFLDAVTVDVVEDCSGNRGAREQTEIDAGGIGPGR